MSLALAWSGGKDSSLALHALREANEVYEAQMEAALAAPPLDTVTEVAFGDLFLADSRAYDEALLADLPPGVDPCGENGEFHTFVHAGPVFDAPIPVATGERVERDGFVYCDILARG